MWEVWTFESLRIWVSIYIQKQIWIYVYTYGRPFRCNLKTHNWPALYECINAVLRIRVLGAHINTTARLASSTLPHRLKAATALAQRMTWLPLDTHTKALCSCKAFSASSQPLGTLCTAIARALGSRTQHSSTCLMFDIHTTARYRNLFPQDNPPLQIPR